MTDLPHLLENDLDVPKEDIEHALSVATDRKITLAQVVVEKGYVGEESLAEAVAQASGTVVIDLRHGEIDREVTRVIPRELAARYLALPLALNAEGDCVRVAFVNPLDESALEVLGQVSQLAIEPLVATFSELQETLARAYRHEPSTQRLRRDLVSGGEWTGAGTTTAPGHTVPLHRLESEATMEQRHEALLLALIDAGALTREDYFRALKRLMGIAE